MTSHRTLPPPSSHAHQKEDSQLVAVLSGLYDPVPQILSVSQVCPFTSLLWEGRAGTHVAVIGKADVISRS